MVQAPRSRKFRMLHGSRLTTVNLMEGNRMPDDHDQLSLRFRISTATRVGTPTKKPRTAARGDIARVKVTLDGIRPPVWRRLEVQTNLSLGALHDILQIAFGWTDSHLHQFHVGDHRFG